MEIKREESPRYKYLELIKKQSVDLFLCYYGIEKCSPCYSPGPIVRSQYIIHYIIDGEGTYTVNNKTFKLRKNQGFLITPDTVVQYEADKTNPWHYMWIAFNGIKSETYLNYANLNIENPIFEYSKDNSLQDYIYEMIKVKELNFSTELQLEGLLYLFMSKLASTRNDLVDQIKCTTSDIYLEKAIEFIKDNYSQNIKINDIANYIGINRSYLTNIFKKKINISPQEFLVNYRIDKACNLLKTTQTSIQTIANCVGYSDPLTFSKIFKKLKGESPKLYRNKFSSALFIE